MSYNINTWKTKKLEGLVIPLTAFYDISEDLKRRGWELDDPSIDPETFVATITGGAEVFECVGEVKDKNIHVSTIELYGDGSGTFMNEILEPALKQSRGQLEAVLIWEGGDSITRLNVNDGVVTENEVDL